MTRAIATQGERHDRCGRMVAFGELHWADECFPIQPPAHVCNWNSAWPTGHPLPPEDPEKLQGPEVGEYVIFPGKVYSYRWVDGVKVPSQPAPDRIVRVIERSYVWSPGECRHRGGYRHYDWSVIVDANDPHYRVVVNDSDLRRVNVGKEND